MANRGRRRAMRGNRRIKRGKRRNQRTTLQTTLRNSARQGIAHYPVMRTLQFYPKVPTASAQPSTSWLDSLLTFGAIAMRLFTFLLKSADSSERPNSSAAALAVVGSTQVILLGAEDLLFSSAICEVETTPSATSFQQPYVDYRQARLSHLTFRLTPGAEMAKRGGRVVFAVISLTEEEIEWYKPATLDGPWKTPDHPSFAEITQLPGAILAPSAEPITLTWRPRKTEFSYRFLRLGNFTSPVSSRNQVGGNPIVKICVGYQDYSSSKPDPTTTYAPEEALLHLDIRGSLTLTENGRTYIRQTPPIVSSSEVVSVATPESMGRFIHHVPLHDLILHEGTIWLDRDSLLPKLESMAL